MKTIEQVIPEMAEGRSEITLKQYLARLKILNDLEPLITPKFLCNTIEIEKKLLKFSEKTRPGFYSAIIALLKCFTSPCYIKLLHFYQSKLKQANERLQEQANTNTKSDKENEFNKTFDELKAVKDELRKRLIFGDTSELNYKNFQSYCVMALYLEIPPRRNQDYAFMVVAKTRPTTADPEKNYFIIDEKKFLFNKYKTSKIFGAQEVNIPESLYEMLLEFMKIHPLRDEPEPFLIVSSSGARPNVFNGILRILQRALGGGSTLIRHLYLSDKYSETLMNMKKDASEMAHSTETQKTYIRV